jgi:endonuclease/exonuclease/phosphatase family metal-dependent hydrolase
MPFTDPPRRMTLGLALAGFAGSLLAALGPISSAPAAGDIGVTVPLRIGSYNIQVTQPFDQFKAGVEFIKTKADVVGLQEIGGTPRRRYIDGDTAWRAYHAADLPQNVVIWNPRVFELVSGKEVKLSDTATIESKSGGTMLWNDNWSPIVRLRQISTGYQFSLIDVHLIRDGLNQGRPTPNLPLTYHVYVHQVRALKRAVHNEKEAGWPVYVTGDFNVGYQADRQVQLRKAPYHRLTNAHLVADWQGKKLNNYGTHIDDSCPPSKAHCGAYIDQIWAPTPAGTARVFIHTVHSDHYPIAATYSVAQPPDYQPPVGSVGFATTNVESPEFNKPWQSRDNPMVFRLTGDTSHGFADVQVTNGTAVKGVDFTVDTSSLYDADPTNDRVLVYTIPNFEREQDKTFTLTLVNPFDTVITQAVATGTILNDD